MSLGAVSRRRPTKVGAFTCLKSLLYARYVCARVCAAVTATSAPHVDVP